MLPIIVERSENKKWAEGDFNMKIHGPNITNINAYKRQFQKQTEEKQTNDTKDKIDISSAAKKLQETNKINEKRAEHIVTIKQAIESGQYEINSERTSEKMIDFWSRRS